MEEPLTVDAISGCTVFPLTSIPNSKGLRAGARDASGEPVAASLLFRSRRGIERQIVFPGATSKPPERVAGSALYMGPLFSHFGHFLLESLARIWLVREYPDIPLAWSIDLTEQRAPYLAWQRDILDLLGVRNPPLFIRTPTLIDQVYVPRPGYRIQNYFHSQLRDFLAVVPHRPEPGRYTWLSRAKLPGMGNRLAPILDERLEAAGWNVVHPQTMPISEQLAHLAASERIAGEQGSALHLLMFLRDLERLRVDIIDRDQDLPPKSQNKNYHTIAVAKQIDQTVHRCDFERFVSRRGAGVDKIGENSFKYLDVLCAPRLGAAELSVTRNDPAGGPKRESPGVARLSELARANGATSYLEIGVADGAEFLQADFQLKHAVGSRFGFDTRNHESGTCRFFETGPDDFFRYFADGETKYDIVRLHGLPSWEQVVRVFCSSQRHCHDGTIWLIEYACPAGLAAAQTSAAHSPKSVAGDTHPTGDVHKAIFMIRDLFANVGYRTVISDGGAQSIVTRRPGEEPAPAFPSIGVIPGTRDSDLIEKMELLNIASEDDMLAWLAS